MRYDISKASAPKMLDLNKGQKLSKSALSGIKKRA